jgi:uncharacterized protein YabN with tetrapyrrole methylase and pyrophosphatase domain
LRRSLRRVGELTTRERVKLLEEAARAVEDAADLIEKALRGTPLYDDAKRYLISRLEKLVPLTGAESWLGREFYTIEKMIRILEEEEFEE